MEIRDVSDNGIKFLIKEEGIVLKPYLDAASIATVGIGSTLWEDGRKVSMSDKPITIDRAISLFRHTLNFYEKGVYSITRDDINQNQFDALTSLCYNIGTYGIKSSTLIKNVNKDIYHPSIKSNFQAWRNATIRGVKKPILLARRTREANLYLTKPAQIKIAPPVRIEPEIIYDDHIKMIQKALVIPQTGIYDKVTENAVMAFQRFHGLQVDGVAGPRTMEILNIIITGTWEEGKV